MQSKNNNAYRFLKIVHKETVKNRIISYFDCDVLFWPTSIYLTLFIFITGAGESGKSTIVKQMKYVTFFID